MQFNSFEYIYFFIAVFCITYLLNFRQWYRLRNLYLLVSSYFFYAQLQFWFVGLLAYITIVTFWGGSIIYKAQQKRGKAKKELWITILLTLSNLLFFKYAYMANPSIVLPVGLSFFTFQALTYTIDIYRKKIAPDSFLNVALFIAFFPTLLSGPIERARNILPLLKCSFPISTNNVQIGIQLFIWGVFKKIVIADRLAVFVNEIYYSPSSYSGSTLALAAIFYSFQIYADFSGYADMAIGSARMLGINVMQNFKFPYFAGTIKEFWRRWHISLTSWFTEYVYISLGGNRVSKARWIFNISSVFLLSGIWHGATESFVIWGAMHAVLYLIEHYWGCKQSNILYTIYVFVMVSVAWVFFRIPDFTQACYVIQQIFTNITSPIYWGSSSFSTALTTLLLIIFLIKEWHMYKQKRSYNYVEYLLIILGICLFGVKSSQFVYFQF